MLFKSLYSFHENNHQTKEQPLMQLKQSFSTTQEGLLMSIKGDEALTIAGLSLKRHTLTLDHLPTSNKTKEQVVVVL